MKQLRLWQNGKNVQFCGLIYLENGKLINTITLFAPSNSSATNFFLFLRCFQPRRGSKKRKISLLVFKLYFSSCYFRIWWVSCKLKNRAHYILKWYGLFSYSYFLIIIIILGNISNAFVKAMSCFHILVNKIHKQCYFTST